MKRLIIFKLFSVILITFCIFSCDERGLEVTPNNIYTQDNFWKNKEEFDAALNGCYESLTHGMYSMGGEGNLFTENFTPNAWDGGQVATMVNGTLSPGNYSLMKTRWRDAYGGIGRTNRFLDKIGSTDFDITQEEKDVMEGQAFFLRALFYYNLVFYYGGVPLILHTPDLEEQKDIPRSSVDEVVNQMLIDLENADQKLPISYTNSGDLGRATKGAALALKARILLFWASPLFNPDGDLNRWAKAAKAAKDVIDIAPTAGYVLFPDYRGLFSLEHEHNEEVIFNVEYTNPRQQNNMDKINNQQNISPTLNLVNSYYMKDGKSIKNSSLYDPAHPFDNRDPRLKQTIVTPGSMFKGTEVTVSSLYQSGFKFKKYTTYKDLIAPPSGYDFKNGLNRIVLRYGNILLIYAEAKNEVSGPDISVYDALNSIRDRAGMSHINSGLSKSQMRKVIHHERRSEFAFEGLYYMDIRRWKIAEDVGSQPIYGLDKDGERLLMKRNFLENNYLWPIPSIVIQRNPALEQNPGY